MNYTIRIKRQENPQASPCWQEFSFEGSADTSIASVLNELNHRSPLCEKSGTVVSPIAWECGMHDAQVPVPVPCGSMVCLVLPVPFFCGTVREALLLWSL